MNQDNFSILLGIPGIPHEADRLTTKLAPLHELYQVAPVAEAAGIEGRVRAIQLGP